MVIHCLFYKQNEQDLASKDYTLTKLNVDEVDEDIYVDQQTLVIQSLYI